MPKNNRNGQAEVWTDDLLDQVMAELSPTMRSLFSICRYTGCRVSEARQLQADDLVNGCIVFRKTTTKGQQTRQVPMHSELQRVLGESELPTTGYLFPGCGECQGHGEAKRPISRQACDKALRIACDRLGYEGFSTHSFRRTALTRMSNAGVPLRVIQEISGHRSLQELQRYLEVTGAQVEGAIAHL